MAKKSYHEYKQEVDENEFEMVKFFNNTDSPVDLVMRDPSNRPFNYGTVAARNTVSAPRFVAEFYARKNINYHVVDAGGVSEVIEDEKKELDSIEAISRAEAEAKEAELKEENELKKLEKEMRKDKLEELKAMKDKKGETVKTEVKVEGEVG